MLSSPAARDWATTHGLRVLIVVLVVVVARQFLAHAIPPVVRRSLVREVDGDGRSEQAKQADTLTQVILGTASIVVLLVAAFLVLAEVGFSVAPVIAGLGITGIAVGLGAQTLVKDAINGIFILGENQFRRGDTVTIANVTGQVEDVSLRRTVLRAEDGTVYSVPNSAIAVAANYTRGYSGISFLVGISFGADLERAIREIDRIGADLARDQAFAPLVIDAPRAVRVESMEDTYLNLRVVGRVVPGVHARVAGELRRRVKEEFDRLGIAYRGSPERPDTPR